MFDSYSIKITIKKNRLTTSAISFTHWEEFEEFIEEHSSNPTLYQISDKAGNFLIYFMADKDNYHLSAWNEDSCFYFCDNTKSDAPIDIGWNSYPAWSVVSDKNKVLKAIRLFLTESELTQEGQWRQEAVDL